MRKATLQNLNEFDFATQMATLTETTRKLKKAGKDVKSLITTQGIDALQITKTKPGAANKFTKEVEDAILEFSLHYPLKGQRTVAKELNKARGWKISEGGVRRVWVRNHIELIDLRIQRLKAYAAAGNPLSESQKEALQPPKIIQKVTPPDVHADHPGELVAQEVYFMGDIPGIGKVYQQIAVDVFSGMIFAKAYKAKTSMTASEFLNSKVLPVFAEHRAPLEAVLTNPGLYFCGNESHTYELYLLLNGIAHKVDRVTAPQLGRIREVFAKEFFGVLKPDEYKTLEDLNALMDDFVLYYNRTRKSKERWRGQFPYSIFSDGVRQFCRNEEAKWDPKLSLIEEKVLDTVQ